MEWRLATTTSDAKMVVVLVVKRWKEMNKEAYPLLLLLLGAFGFVTIVVCYIKGWLVGIFTFFQELDTLYYIIIFPMGIGFFACILKYHHG